LPLRRMSTTVKVALALVGIALLVAFLFRRVVFHKLFDEDDERPPIIVHNGSLVFESQKNWKKHPSKLHYRLDHPTGASLRSYSVQVTGSITPACAGTTLTEVEVFVEYRADATAPVKQFHLDRAFTFALPPATVKREPLLDSPEPLTMVPGSGTAPAKLIYEVGEQGWISNVKVGTVSCAFKQPASPAERAAVSVTITPQR
jgi:hypothetical protein